VGNEGNYRNKGGKMYNYRTVNTRTPGGLKTAEWYRTHGWRIISVGLYSIIFEKQTQGGKMEINQQ
jgi:hypothetical protein